MSFDDDIARARVNVETATRELRRLLTVAVVLRDGTLCHYCGAPTLLTATGHPQRRTLDHIIPQVFGGKDTLDNLVLSCQGCNSRKGAQVSRSQLCPSCSGAARVAGEGRG